MKIHIDLMLVIRQTVFTAGIHLENITLPYVAVLELLLQAAILGVTLNLNTILAMFGI